MTPLPILAIALITAGLYLVIRAWLNRPRRNRPIDAYELTGKGRR